MIGNIELSIDQGAEQLVLAPWATMDRDVAAFSLVAKKGGSFNPTTHCIVD